jgi:hypothetical protein
MIARLLVGQKLTLKLPVASDWLESQRKKATSGWLIVSAGLLCLIGGTISYVLLVASGAVSEQSTQWLIVFILGGPLLAVGGVFYVFASQESVATVRHSKDGFVWLTGVHASFLARLPEWKAAN